MEKIVAELGELISISSVFPDERELASHCSRSLKESGFSVRLESFGRNRVNVLARKGKGEPLFFYAHLDTVPPCADWKNPFKLTQKGDRLLGLGSWDMKAGIAIILEACRAVEPEGYELRVALCSDEENISQGAWSMARSGFLQGVRRAVVPEICDSGGAGQRIIIGRRGRAVYAVRVLGESAHGAKGTGVNAINKAAKLLPVGFRTRKHAFLGYGSQFVRSFSASGKGLSVPEEAVFEIDRHIVPPETPESVLSVLKKTFKNKAEVELVKRETPYLMPYVVDSKSEWVSFVRRVAGPLPFSSGLSVADENVLAMHGVQPITFGPEGGNAHAAGEWVSKKSLLKTSGIYERILREFGASF